MKDDQITTLCTLYTPLVTVVRNSYVHARIHLRMLMVPNSEAEILKLSKLPKVMDGLPLTRKFANGRHPRTGTFHQMVLTAGDTSRSVKGVLAVY